MLGDDLGAWKVDDHGPGSGQEYFTKELVPLFLAEDPSDYFLPPSGVYWLSPIFRDLLSISSHMVEGKAA